LLIPRIAPDGSHGRRLYFPVNSTDETDSGPTSVACRSLLIPRIPDESDGDVLYFPVNSALGLELRETAAIA
jgi:hypothetical protein